MEISARWGLAGVMENVGELRRGEVAGGRHKKKGASSEASCLVTETSPQAPKTLQPTPRRSPRVLRGLDNHILPYPLHKIQTATIRTNDFRIIHINM